MLFNFTSFEHFQFFCLFLDYSEFLSMARFDSLDAKGTVRRGCQIKSDCGFVTRISLTCVFKLLSELDFAVKSVMKVLG
jgi:hypothetical protein